MSIAKKDLAVVSGAGPSGIAAAIMLHQQGWKDIKLVERRPKSVEFDRGKAFNYQLDGRGQKMLASIGMNEETVKQYGVANLESVFTSFGPDGEAKTLKIPFVLKDKQTAYWVTRSALLEMLSSRLEAVNTDGRIELIHAAKIERIDTGDAQVKVSLSHDDGSSTILEPDLVLGCDGLNSGVRAHLAGLASTQSKDFTMVAKPSPSSCLLYKVIRLPTKLKVNGGAVSVSDNRKSYIFSSAYKTFEERLSLFSLPVARDNEPRTANIILPQSHKLWSIDSLEDLRAYLVKGFPQLDIDELFPGDELQGFLDLKAGKFPDPQYSPKVVANLPNGETSTTCVLLGDAAHSFPPDLGLGVNSALQDVYLFSQELLETPDNIAEAALRYEKKRLPESRALVRLVRTVFPYQYNHVPWRFNVSLAKLLAQIGLAKITNGLINEPTFRLSQDERLSYTALERKKNMTDATFYALLAVLIGGLGYFIWSLLT